MKMQIKKRTGFTLVEIMIVVVIIGILVTMIIPAFQRIRQASQNSKLMNDFRIYANAFSTYAIENGYYPPDVGPGTIPAGMAEYLHQTSFLDTAAIGGTYDWDEGVFGVTAGISVHQYTASNEQLQRFEDKYDDGNLGSGEYRTRSNGFMHIIAH